MSAQKTEFIIGLSNVEGAKKYSPQAATVNGVDGRIWTRRSLKNGAWIHDGKVFVRQAAAETEVHGTVDESLE